MRIGIDARELCGRATGVGRYLSGLLAEWASAPRARQHRFVLYAPQTLPQTLDRELFTVRVVGARPDTWWEQIVVPRAAADDRLDAWFAPAYTAPLRLEVPVVLTVHDLSYFAHPEWFTVRDGIRRRWLTRKSVTTAAGIITISQFSKRELIERLGVPAERIDVISPGITSPLASSLGASSPQPPAPGPRVLFVGSLFTRRHIGDLIRAFVPIAHAHADACLEIAGDNRTYPWEDPRQTITSAGISTHVRWHAYVTDADLRELYAHATAFAFLSEYEGLGLTPLEALAAGVPPVLGDTPVARESCDNAAVYVPIADVPATTAALERALFDEETRAQILDAAPAVLARYQWSRAADDTLCAIERCSR